MNGATPKIRLPHEFNLPIPTRIFPSSLELAKLAAMMKSGATEAFLLWMNCDYLMSILRDAEPCEAERMIIKMEKGEKDLEVLQDGNFIPVEQAMKSIGVRTEKTLWETYRRYVSENIKTSKSGAGLNKQIETAIGFFKVEGIPEDVVAELAAYRKALNVQRGYRNRLAVKKGKRRKRVK